MAAYNQITNIEGHLCRHLGRHLGRHLSGASAQAPTAVATSALSRYMELSDGDS